MIDITLTSRPVTGERLFIVAAQSDCMTGQGHTVHGLFDLRYQFLLTALETKLAFHYVVKGFVVVASISVIDQV